MVSIRTRGGLDDLLCVKLHLYILKYGRNYISYYH